MVSLCTRMTLIAKTAEGGKHSGASQQCDGNDGGVDIPAFHDHIPSGAKFNQTDCLCYPPGVDIAVVGKLPGARSSFVGLKARDMVERSLVPQFRVVECYDTVADGCSSRSEKKQHTRFLQRRLQRWPPLGNGLVQYHQHI